MNESQISVRYAKALFQSALGLNMLDAVYRDMELVAKTCKLDDFWFMLTQPSLQPSQKCRLVETILKKHISEISHSLIELVIQNKREEYLPGIARNFRELYRKAKGIKTATISTAQPVEEETLNNIRKLIRKTYEAEVELTSAVDEDLIGGFILTVENMQYDASVASNLKKIKKELLQTSIVKK